MQNRGSIYYVTALLLLFGLCACDPNAPTFPQLAAQQASANKVNVTSIDYEVRKWTSSEDWIYLTSKDIDLSNFRNADSVTFATSLRCQQEYALGIAQLYNFDEDRAITNSQVESNVRAYFKYVESQDILQFLPQDKAEIGIRIRSSQEGVPIEIAYETAIKIYTH